MTYIYPQNMKASANMWLWSLKDFAILAVSALASVLLFATLKSPLFLAITFCFAFLTIRADETTVLDYIKFAVRYFLSTQQQFEWR